MARVTYHSMVTSADSDVLRVLADPLRSRIVALLAEEALCVCHLVEETGAKQTNLSNHLKALREVGLVETEPCGRFVYYKLLLRPPLKPLRIGWPGSRSRAVRRPRAVGGDPAPERSPRVQQPMSRRLMVVSTSGATL